MKLHCVAFISAVLASEESSSYLRRRLEQTEAQSNNLLFDPRSVALKMSGAAVQQAGPQFQGLQQFSGTVHQYQQQLLGGLPQLTPQQQLQQRPAQMNPIQDPSQITTQQQQQPQPQQQEQAKPIQQLKNSSFQSALQRQQEQQLNPLPQPEQIAPKQAQEGHVMTTVQQLPQTASQPQEKLQESSMLLLDSPVKQDLPIKSVKQLLPQDALKQQQQTPEIQKLPVLQQSETRQRRKFVSYSSSEWELMWLDNVDKWEKEQKICEVLFNEQARYIHDYLNLMCSARLEPPYDHWCVIDDTYLPLWYNTQNRQNLEISWGHPEEVPDNVAVPPRKPVTPGPQHSHIASKFVFYDEITNEHYVEYIEPLVSHLRFPLSKCVSPPPGKEELKYHDTLFRGWLIPPPPVIRGDRAVYVDAGDSSWEKGINYFTNLWKRSGILFDEIFAFDDQTKREIFYQSMPEDIHNKVHFKQCMISTNAEQASSESPFLPKFVDEKTQLNDYVLMKLDIGLPNVEAGNIDYILNDPNSKVDELVWEHHVSGNYLMAEHWQQAVSQLSLRQSYERFLRLRQKGIRAHSWV